MASPPDRRRRERPDDLIAVARCGEPDGGHRRRRVSPAQHRPRSARLHLHRQADLPARPRPCTSRPWSAGASAIASIPFDRAAGRVVDRRSRRQGPRATGPEGRRVRRRRTRRSACRRPPRSATTRFASPAATRAPSGSFEVQEYRKPEFEVLVLPADRFVVQGAQGEGDGAGALLLRPAGGARLAHVRALQVELLLAAPLERGERRRAARRLFLRGRSDCGEQTVRLDEKGEATIALDLPEDDDGRDYTLRVDARVTDASGREVSGKGAVIATRGDFLIATSLDRYVYRAGERAELRVRAADYLGTPRAGVAVAVALERITYPGGYGSERQITTVAQGRCRPTPRAAPRGRRRCRPTPAAIACAPRRSSAGRSIEDESSLWIPGSSEATYGESERYLEMVADRGPTRPATPRGSCCAAPTSTPRCSSPRRRRRSPGTRSSPCRRVRPSRCPIDESDVGDTWVNIVFLKDDRSYRAEKQLRVPPTSRGVQVSITADAGRGETARSGHLHDHARSTRPARRCARRSASPRSTKRSSR